MPQCPHCHAVNPVPSTSCPVCGKLMHADAEHVTEATNGDQQEASLPSTPPSAILPPPPDYPGTMYPSSQPQQGANGFCVASLVLGIVAVPTCILAGLGVVPGVLAIIFGILGRRDQPAGRGMATAGLTLGIIGGALSVLYWVFIFMLVSGGMQGLFDSRRGY